MTILRNLSGTDIPLNDLGGITIIANSDYDLSEETINDLSNSNDLNDAINSGGIVFLDSQGVPLSQQESLNVQNAVSLTTPAFDVRVGGNAVPGSPFNKLNFGVNIIATDNNPTAKVSFESDTKLLRTNISGQDILTFNDSTRSDKLLSIEKVPFLFTQATVSSDTYLKLSDVVTNTSNGYVMPMNGTVVGLSSHIDDPSGRTGKYSLYINNSSASNTLITYSGSSQSQIVINNLNINITAGQKLQFVCTDVSGGMRGGKQYDVNVVLYVRWRG